jgi:hypothetical protein
MNDPLTRALDEAPDAREERIPGQVGTYRTDHAPPLGAVLDGLREQLIEAMAVPFFDGAPNVTVTPVTKHALAEAGAVTIVVRKRDPAYEATVELEVRCDHDTPAEATEAGGYQVSARAHLRCDDARGRIERDVDVTVREIEGCLRVDVVDLRAAMAGAIHSIGKASAR